MFANRNMTSKRTNLASGVLSGLLLLAAGLTSAAAQPAGEPGARNVATVRAGFAAWADGTGSPYDDLADDARWTITGNSVVARTYASREDFLANVIRPFGARMSRPLVPIIHRIYSDADTVIVHFDAEGTARDGKPYRNTYAWFLALRDGKIVEATAFFDSIAFDEFWNRVAPSP